MSDTENNNQNEVMNLLKRIKKQLKELDTTVNQKIAELKEAIESKKQVENKTTDEEKEKMDKIFEKRQIGRPAGDFNSKRRQYFELIKAKKIKQPKQQTLEYYKINYDKSTDTYTLLEIENED